MEKGIPFLVFPLVLSTIPKFNKGDVDKLLNFMTLVFVAAVLFYISYAGIKFWESGDATLFYWKNLTDPFSFHPTYLSVVIVFLMSVVIDKIITRGAGVHTFELFILFLFFGTLLLLSSKIQIVVFFALSTYFFAKIAMDGGRVKIAVIGLCALAILIVMTSRINPIRERFSHIQTFNYELDAPVESFNEVTIRFALAECAFLLIKEDPLLGVGVGDVDHELMNIYQRVDYKFGYLDKQNPHNQYLSTTIATGLIGLAALLLIFVHGFIRWSANQRRWYLVFLLLCLVNFLFESMLERQKGIVLFSLINSLFLFHVSSPSRSETNAVSNSL